MSALNSNIQRVIPSGLDTAPLHAESISGKATYVSGSTIKITDFVDAEILKLRPLDGLLINDELVIVADTPKFNTGASAINIRIKANRLPSAPFADEDILWAKGNNQDEYPIGAWSLNSSAYKVDGVIQNRPLNFIGNNGMVLVEATTVVKVSNAHVSSGSSSGGGSSSGVSIVAGTLNVQVDNTDPLNPIISVDHGLFPYGTKLVSVSRDYQANDAGYVLVMIGDNVKLTMPAIVPFSEGDNIGVCDVVPKSTRFVGNNSFNVINGGDYILPEPPETVQSNAEVVLLTCNTLAGVLEVAMVSSPSVSDGGSAKTLLRYLSDHGGGGGNYKTYSALLTQSGTGAPSVVVLQNTIGDIVWSYDSPGNYVATLLGAFTANKTWMTIQNSRSLDEGWFSVINDGVDDFVVVTGTIGDGGIVNPANNILTLTSIEIRVYP